MEVIRKQQQKLEGVREELHEMKIRYEMLFLFRLLVMYKDRPSPFINSSWGEDIHQKDLGWVRAGVRAPSPI